MSAAEPVKPIVKCAKCRGNVTITRTQQLLTVHGKDRLHASCQCRDCGHEWWSRRRSVVAWSRHLDRQAT